MKKIHKIIFGIGMSAVLITQSGCFGEFALTQKLWKWNKGVSDSRFVQTLVFYLFNIIPVYGVCGMVDIIILNLVEFWTGTNPMAMNEGQMEQQMVTKDGINYLITATKNQFKVETLTGAKTGEMATLKFDPTAKSWTASNGKQSQEIMQFAGTNNEQVRYFKADGSFVTVSATATPYEVGAALNDSKDWAIAK